MKTMNLPNRLTIVRIILTPIFLGLFLSDIEHHFLWGLIVFAAGSFTDFLDGKIARKNPPLSGRMFMGHFILRETVLVLTELPYLS